MGESMMHFANDAEKVVEGETVASNSSNSVLEVSVSFGRFENDSSLSWEKWSTFSPNKYLEEVEKCATPGSVAQKRAYFEAHYKRVAARKAEEMMEQEKQLRDGDTFRSDSDQTSGDQTDSEVHFEIDLANNQINAQGNDQEANFDNEIIKTYVDDLEEDDVFTIEFPSSLAEGEREEADCRTDSPDLNNPEDELAVVKEVENVPSESQGVQEIPRTLDNDVGSAPEFKEVTPLSKERNVANVKKKPVPLIAKTPQKFAPRASKSVSTPTPKALKPISTPTPKASKPVSTPTPKASKPISTSTPRVSKPISTSTPRVSKSISTSTPRVSKSLSTSTATPASRSSVKKSTAASFPRSKNPSTEETKEVPPKHLHLSLNVESSPTMSGSAFVTTTTRKSSIMENMGDKDIVKRAFKTFQNTYNQPQPSSEEKPPTPKQLSTKGKESRVSTSAPLTKENGGYLDKRTAKAAPSSVSLRSDDCVDKREFSQKLAAKSNVKVTEKAHSQPKSKDQKEAEIKKLRHSLNFKATPTPCVYRGQKVSKSTSEKESLNNETHR
ncbi:unnamed protein product [Malus baccata var. baccata]